MLKFLFFTLILYSCSNYSIKPYLKQNNNKFTKAICIDLKLDSNYAKIIKNTLSNLIDPHRNFDDNNIRQCKYLLKFVINFNKYPIADISGAQTQNAARMDAHYSLFKISKDKIENLEDIIKNPSPIIFSDDISNRFSGIAKHKYRFNHNQDAHYKALYDSYEKDVARIEASDHKLIASGNLFTIDSYNANPILLTSEYQSAIDSAEFMSQTLARDIFNRLVIALEHEIES